MPEIDRYSRQRSIPGWDQESLFKSRLLIAGLGGLGNELAKNLAELGVGQLILVDKDQVDQPNLSRCVLFREWDLARPKSEVAAQRLSELNPQLKSIPLNLDLIWELGLGVYRRVDLVLSCLDNRWARLMLNRACYKLGKLWINAGIQGWDGSLEIYSPPSTGCYECGFSSEDYQLLQQEFSCFRPWRFNPAGSSPNSIIVCSIIAGIQAQEAVKLLMGDRSSVGTKYVYSGSSNTITRHLIPFRQDCPSHQLYPSITQSQLGWNSRPMDLLELDSQLVGEYGILELDREIVLEARCSRCSESEFPFKSIHLVKDICECGSDLQLTTTHRIAPDSELARIKFCNLGIPRLHILPVIHSSSMECYELSSDAEFLGI